MKWILLILFIGVIGGMVFLIRKTLNKMNQTDGGVVVPTDEMKTAQEFLPFVDVEDGVLDLGGFKYRMIVECSSINYNLKTQTEKDIIEGSFRKFLNSISYPISFYIQTKEINYGNIVSGLRKDIDETIEDYPQLKDYAEYYYNQIVHLKQSIGNTKQKKKYIIIPYEEAISMNELSPEEKKSYSIKEIQNRARQVADGISSLGLTTKTLNTQDIIELLYSMNHRDDDSFVETIGSGEYLVDVVGNGKEPQKVDELKQAIEILQEAENRFRVKILDHNLPNEAGELFSAITQDISKMKKGLLDIESNGGYNSLKSFEDIFNEGEDVAIPSDNISEVKSEESSQPIIPDISKYQNNFGGDN